MIFSISTLSFTVGSLILEGYAAFAARCVISLALLAAGWVVHRQLIHRLYPKLLSRHWKLKALPILIRSFALPASRLVWFTSIFFALRALPWALAFVPAALLKIYRIALIFCLCHGLYNASELSELIVSSFGPEVRSNKTLLSALRKLYQLLIVILGVMMIAQESGLPVTGILTSAGLVGLTISLAAQDSASNLFSGIMILLERPFRIGDWVVIGDVEGTVEDINFRSTRIRALDNSLYILTNSSVCSTTINNCAERQKRLYRFTLGVTYDTTRPQLEKLMADLTEMLTQNPDVYADSVLVRLTGFGASSIDLLVSAYLRTADTTRFLEIQNALNLDLMDIMVRNKISFAFPSTSVYIEQTGPKPQS